jgi:hypothetical protein
VLEGIYGTPLYRVRGGQFRYIYILDKKWKNRLLVKPQPYPKERDLKNYLIIKKDNGSKEDIFSEYMDLIS